MTEGREEERERKEEDRSQESATRSQRTKQRKDRSRDNLLEPMLTLFSKVLLVIVTNISGERERGEREEGGKKEKERRGGRGRRRGEERKTKSLLSFIFCLSTPQVSFLLTTLTLCKWL